MWIHFIYYLAIGAIAGTLSGLLGIGGGVVIVPLLVLVYTLQKMPGDLVMHMAVATSLAGMIVTTASAVMAHHRYGSKIWSTFKLLAPGVAIGSIVGAIIAHKLSTHTLQIAFSFFVFIIAIHLITPSKTKVEHHLPQTIGCYVISGTIGIISSLLGLGGGTFMVPFLAYCSIDMRDAVGISAACSLVISIVSTLSFMLLGALHHSLPVGSTGYIYWPAVICIAMASPFFALWGANLSHRLPVKRLRQIFAVFLLGVAIYML